MVGKSWPLHRKDWSKRIGEWTQVLIEESETGVAMCACQRGSVRILLWLQGSRDGGSGEALTLCSRPQLTEDRHTHTDSFCFCSIFLAPPAGKPPKTPANRGAPCRRWQSQQKIRRMMTSDRVNYIENERNKLFLFSPRSISQDSHCFVQVVAHPHQRRVHHSHCARVCCWGRQENALRITFLKTVKQGIWVRG